jgi:hypothetical protein
MVRYLLTTGHAQDEQEADALAQLTDAVLATAWAGELVHYELHFPAGIIRTESASSFARVA